MRTGNWWWDPLQGGIPLSTWGAIAYSPQTGRYGWSSRKLNQAEAEQAALSFVGASDARVVCCGSNTILALALSDERGYGYAWGHRPQSVEREALYHCQGTNCRIVLLYNPAWIHMPRSGRMQTPSTRLGGAALPKGGVVLVLLFVVIVVVLALLSMNGIYVLPGTPHAKPQPTAHP